MNDIIYLENNTPAMQQATQIRQERTKPRKRVHNDIHDTSLFDDVAVDIGPLYDAQNAKMGNAFALYYQDGVRASESAVSGTHSITNHAPLYQQHEDLIKYQSDLPWQNVEVTDELSDNGLKARRSIKYLDAVVDIGSGDPINCRSDIINSVNMTWAFQMFAGAYRNLCENSMVFGGVKSGYAKKKHTKHFEQMKSALLNTANSTLHTFATQTERFMQWHNTKLNDDDAIRFIRSQCDSRTDDQKRWDEIADSKQPSVFYDPTGNILNEDDENLNKKKFYSLCSLWEEYSKGYSQGGGLGRNVWALYNVFTHWATHTHDSVVYQDGKGEMKQHALGRDTKNLMRTESGKDYSILAQKDRSLVVAVMLTSPQWQSLAA